MSYYYNSDRDMTESPISKPRAHLEEVFYREMTEWPKQLWHALFESEAVADAVLAYDPEVDKRRPRNRKALLALRDTWYLYQKSYVKLCLNDHKFPRGTFTQAQLKRILTAAEDPETALTTQTVEEVTNQVCQLRFRKAANYSYTHRKLYSYRFEVKEAVRTAIYATILELAGAQVDRRLPLA